VKEMSFKSGVKGGTVLQSYCTSKMDAIFKPHGIVLHSSVSTEKTWLDEHGVYVYNDFSDNGVSHKQKAQLSPTNRQHSLLFITKNKKNEICI